MGIASAPRTEEACCKRAAERLMLVPHMDLHVSLTVLEASSVAFSGTIFFPAVSARAVPLGAAAPSKWAWLGGPTRQAERCKLRGVSVRLTDHQSGAELVKTMSDALGTQSAGVSLQPKTGVLP